MVHYTLLPPQVIFEDKNEEAPEYKEIEVEGIKMVVEVEQFNRARIVRLLSTDPQHYLDERFTPGNCISFKTEFL